MDCNDLVSEFAATNGVARIQFDNGVTESEWLKNYAVDDFLIVNGSDAPSPYTRRIIATDDSVTAVGRRQCSYRTGDEFILRDTPKLSLNTFFPPEIDNLNITAMLALPGIAVIGRRWFVWLEDGELTGTPSNPDDIPFSIGPYLQVYDIVQDEILGEWPIDIYDQLDTSWGIGNIRHVADLQTFDVTITILTDDGVNAKAEELFVFRVSNGDTVNNTPIDSAVRGIDPYGPDTFYGISVDTEEPPFHKYSLKRYDGYTEVAAVDLPDGVLTEPVSLFGFQAVLGTDRLLLVSPRYDNLAAPPMSRRFTTYDTSTDLEQLSTFDKEVNLSGFFPYAVHGDRIYLLVRDTSLNHTVVPEVVYIILCLDLDGATVWERDILPTHPKRTVFHEAIDEPFYDFYKLEIVDEKLIAYGRGFHSVMVYTLDGDPVWKGGWTEVPRISTLTTGGALNVSTTGEFPETPQSIVSDVFLHAGHLHILGNGVSANA